MKTVKIPSEGYGSNCWLIISGEEYVIIDPSAQLKSMLERIEQRGLNKENLKYVLLTHGHFDHILGADDIREETGAPLLVHELDADCLYDPSKNLFKYFFREDLILNKAENVLHDGDEIHFGNEKLTVMHTPGHTVGSVCYISDTAVYSGDTLFDLGIGRTDLPGGDPAVQLDSLKKLMKLSGELELYPGHGSLSTMQKQFDYNPYLKGLK